MTGSCLPGFGYVLLCQIKCMWQNFRYFWAALRLFCFANGNTKHVVKNMASFGIFASFYWIWQVNFRYIFFYIFSKNAKQNKNLSLTEKKLWFLSFFLFKSAFVMWNFDKNAHFLVIFQQKCHVMWFCLRKAILCENLGFR